MNGRRAKQAHRLLKKYFPGLSDAPQHSNIRQHQVELPASAVNPDGTLRTGEVFHYETSTVTIPARKECRRAKRTLKEVIQDGRR